MIQIKHPLLKNFLRYLIAMLILAIAIFLRFWLLPVEAGYPHLTIYPATILCFLLCGLGPGILVTLISTVLTFYFFVKPHYTFDLSDEALIVLPIYLISSLMLGFIVMKSQNFAKKLQLANDKLNLTLNSQRRFIENASHQLRTPLAGLKVQAERAISAKDLETIKPALLQIKNSADRIAHLSTQLLVLARSESTMQKSSRFKTLDLSRLARLCCMDWVPKALERDIDLGFDAPVEPLYISGDETLLWELLSNLLDNAVRYGHPGGEINVKIEANTKVSLIVEDNGPGIHSQETDKVFERFYRIPDSPGDGCGLGLAIVKEIANLHEAQVTVGIGLLGHGTRFEISFEKSARNGTHGKSKQDKKHFLKLLIGALSPIPRNISNTLKSNKIAK